MLLKKATLFGCIVFLLTSCASNSEPPIDWLNGAKRGWIVELYAPDASEVNLPECLAMLPKSERSKRHFAKVEYRHVRQMFTTIAEVPAAIPLKVDDQVEVWPENCAKGKFSRISRLLYPSLR